MSRGAAAGRWPDVRAGVHIHRSERTDALLVDLAEVLREVPDDPFAVDVVAVPTPGIERFLSQGLGRVLGSQDGRSDGVCANVAFPSPASIVNRVIAQHTGVTPDTDPWLAHRAVWPLLAVIDRSADEAWCGALARHLGLARSDAGADRPGDGSGGPNAGEAKAWDRAARRFAVASRLAELFATYASQRPGLLLDWHAGRDDDGAGGPLPDDLAWQPELWRRLRAEIGSPSPAERLDAACAAVTADRDIVDLPGRISVFGPSRLPADHLRVLAALGTGREVHLWLSDASPTLWQALADGSGNLPRRREDRSDAAVRHPLLQSLGRDSRELRLRLAAIAGLAGSSDAHSPSLPPAATLLGNLQHQIHANVDPWAQRAAHGAFRMPADDRSIQVHSCHGQPRQADVVREVVLGLLQADPTLEPRDILIMCPDLDAFAPLLSAAFSELPDGAALPAARMGPASRTGTASSIGRLRLRIADRTPEQSNEVLGALAAVLAMIPGRMRLSEVLDLAAHSPLRARFGFDDEDLARLGVLTTQAGIRWGLDDDNRAEYALPLSTGTWAWGLDRLLLGVSMSEEGLPRVGGVLPVDDVQGGDVALVGRLAELVTRLRGLRAAMTAKHPVGGWAKILGSAVTDLMAAAGPDAWQIPNALGAITALTGHATGYADTVELGLAEVRWLLDGMLAGRPTRSNFRSGGLTVCGLMPMRSVPHRVICLVGMDDGAFPRVSARDGDDVLGRDPLIGERDPRSEDRQLLLDAIMAATDHLVITYTGADDRTNEPRPPCVPLGELLDTLDAMAVTATGTPARTGARVEHPLQPFDARNFTPGALGTPEPFSHDRPGLAGALVATLPRSPVLPFIAGDLPELPVSELSLRDLASFLVSPPAMFLRARIGIPLRGAQDRPPEEIPIELDGLAAWGIGERALRLILRGEPEAAVAAAEQLRGQLPPGALGVGPLSAIGRDVTSLSGRVRALRVGPARQVGVALELDGGVRLVGTVPDVYGRTIVRATYSKSKAVQELRLWPELLAAAAAPASAVPASAVPASAVPAADAPSGLPSVDGHTSGRGWSARLVTRDGVVALAAPGPEECLRILAELAALHRAGTVSVLPLLADTGLAYAQRRVRGTSVSASERAAQFGAWQAKYGAERDLPEVVTLWGASAPLASLLAERPRADEQWYPDEPSRFGALARRIWEPILAARAGSR